MKCSICGKEKAVLHIQEIIGNERKQLNICKVCESNRNIIEKCLELEFNNIDTIFQDCKSLVTNRKNKKIDSIDKICKFCGYSLADYFKTGLLSCPKCYEYFKSELSKSVKKVHKENRHIGKISNKHLTYNDIETQILEYNEQIDLLIKIEKYEEAALVRDKLDNLHKNLMSKKPKTKSEKKDVR